MNIYGAVLFLAMGCIFFALTNNSDNWIRSLLVVLEVVLVFSGRTKPTTVLCESVDIMSKEKRL
jgi:hypothetical protein